MTQGRATNDDSTVILTLYVDGVLLAGGLPSYATIKRKLVGRSRC